MESHSPSDNSTSDALAALGKLRERLAAVRNLEHLISSRNVGPKLLAQVVPDVAGMLGLWDAVAQTLSERIEKALGLESARLSPLLTLAQAEIAMLLTTFREVSASLAQAKSRLVLERVLGESVPALHTAVAHWELLVEATRTHSVSMSVGEFLSSSPDTGSERPYRPLKVRGALDDLRISLPPRAGLSCLAALGSLEPALGLVITGVENDQIRFAFEPVKEAQLIAQLPVFPSSNYVRLLVTAALSPHQGAVDAAGVGFTVPAHSH